MEEHDAGEQNTRANIFTWAIYVLPLVLLTAGLVVDRPLAIVAGLGRIVTSPSVLLHDYLAVGGLGAALVNAGLCGIVACLIISILKIEVNGAFIAAVYTVAGFAFFGKNVFNIWPILAGVSLFARVQKVPLRNYALVALFGTTLAPLVSAVAFDSHHGGAAAIALGIGLGIAAGFVLPPLASHMLRFHDGYNIYNVGFTGGIIGSFMTASLRSFDFTILPVSVLSVEYDVFLKTLLISCFVLLVAGGVILDRRRERSLARKLKQIYASSGRLVSDFMLIGDHASTLVNMGVMGLLASLFVILLGGSFNGPVIGGVLTVTGFAAFGKHAKNCIPVLVGVYLASLFKVWDTGSTEVIIAGLFGTTLAPVAGQFGALAGAAAGFFHLSVVMNVGMLHGGLNLYNNGFAGGFVAACMVPVLNALKKEDRR